MHRNPKTRSTVPAQGGGGGSNLSNFVVRTITTFAMIFGCLFLCFYGQSSTVMLIVLLQIGMWMEIISIAQSQRNKVGLSPFLHWYFLGVCLLFFHGRALREVTLDSWPEMDTLQQVLRHLNFVCFALYCGGLVLFILSLQPTMLVSQFTHLAWNHMALLFIVGQGTFFVNAMFDGMIWFLFPCSIIISNDIWAYVSGKLFGRHQLIQLSPKKTWEGFLGAIILTIIWGFFASWAFSQFPRIICPKERWWVTPNCENGVPPVFGWKEYALPGPLTALLGPTITLMPIMVHSISFSLFGSIIGPFGGFFASGLKRAFKVKDFGALIPGHGGVTDRMDCQLMMALFTYLYLDNFVHPSGGVCSKMSVMRHCSQRMPLSEQMALFNALGARLLAAGAQIHANGTAFLP